MIDAAQAYDITLGFDAAAWVQNFLGAGGDLIRNKDGRMVGFYFSVDRDDHGDAAAALMLDLSPAQRAAVAASAPPARGGIDHG